MHVVQSSQQATAAACTGTGDMPRRSVSIVLAESIRREVLPEIVPDWH